MVNFLHSQTDFLFFLNGFFLCCLAALSFLLERSQKAPADFPWQWLGFFAVSQGILELSYLFVLSQSITFFSIKVIQALLCFPAIFLFETCRRSTFTKISGKISHATLLLFLLLMTFLWGSGNSELYMLFVYVYFPFASIWLAFIFYRNIPLQTNKAKTYYAFAGLMIAVYIFTAFLQFPIAYFPAIFKLTVFTEILHTLCLNFAALALWVYYNSIENKTFFAHPHMNILKTAREVIIVYAIIAFGWLLTENIGHAYRDESRDGLLSQVKTAAANLDPSLIKNFLASNLNTASPDFIRLREELTEIRLANRDCRYVYLLGYKNKKVYFLVDSEPLTSRNYSPPGEVYDEATPALISSFSRGLPFTEGPLQDRWGVWVSGLVPMYDKESHTIIGVLGIDVNANNWEILTFRHRFIGILITLAMCILACGFLLVNILNRSAATRIQASEKRFQVIFENAPEAIFIFDPTTHKILAANAFTSRWLNYTHAELLKLSFGDIILRKKENVEPMASLFPADATPSFHEYAYQNKNGELIPAETIATRTTFQNRNAIIVFARDISTRKHQEEALRESEHRFSIIFEEVNEGIVLAEAETKKFSLFNKAFCSLLGYNEFELKQLRVDDIHPQESMPYIQELFQKSVLGQSIFAPYIAVKRKDGSLFYADISASKIEFNGKPYMVGIFRDITERRNTIMKIQDAYRELKDAHEKLIQSEKMAAIGQLSVGIAHELKNPLAIILMSIEKMKYRLSRAATITPEDVTMIEKAATRANKVISGLLSFSRSSRLELTFLNITDAIDRAFELVQHKLKEKGITMHKEYAPGLLSVSADRVLLEQVFSNLFLNAADATHNNGNIYARAHLSETQKEVVVEIADDGCGMTPEILSRIFEPFFTTKDEGKGTGLGLSLVYLLIKRHNGEIFVESTLGKGTKFTITLPLIRC